MKNFYVVTNEIKDKDRKVTNQIAEYLREHGCECHIHEKRAEGDAQLDTDPKDIPEGVECIIVLGGDGTLLRAARNVVSRQIPLLGINLGTLGYLAEIDVNAIYPALEKLIAGEVEIEHRMMLQGIVMRGDQEIARNIALNDIVISRAEGMHVIGLDNFINDSYLNSYKADGVIISTPTGSTSYSLSAGGPIVAPSAAMFLMTPLAPHTLNSRSVVLPQENTITVQIQSGRDETVEHARVYFDATSDVSVITGDKVIISRAEKDTLIAKVNKLSFLEVLSKKMSHA